VTVKSIAQSKAAQEIMDLKAIEQALSLAIPGEWDKESKYKLCKQAEAIATVLINKIHTHLGNAKIGYLFKETIMRGGRPRWGWASKAGGKLAYYSKLDFVVEISWTGWKDMTPQQRVALVDQMLCHFGIEETEHGKRNVLIPSDLEEFTSIVSRWGLWMPDVQKMHRIMVQQHELFEEPKAAAGGE
jgi:hypothetical protein